MALSRRQQFVYGQVAWMLGLVLLFTVMGVLSLETFFVGSFLGFLVLLDATDPINFAPAWRERLKWVILLGLVGFGYIIVERILRILPKLGS